jgi:AcrR family transcriptional regulator
VPRGSDHSPFRNRRNEVNMAAFDTKLSTRQKLIAGAFAVVAREGLDGASVKTIAAQAGVAPGLLHYHFPTKEALLVAALQQGLSDYLDQVRTTRLSVAADHQISAFFDAARTRVFADRDLFKVRLAFAAKAMTDPGLSPQISAITSAAIDEIALVMAAACGRTEPLESDVALAATLKGGFDGLMLAWLNDPDFPIERAGDVLQVAARAWLAEQ